MANQKMKTKRAAAKRFKTNIPIAIALAGVLLYPTMTAGNVAGAEAMSLFGLPILFALYSVFGVLGLRFH